MDFKDAELIYKTALVFTASPQRLILVLYNKMIVELKKSLALYLREPINAMNSLNHAHKVLNELLTIFLTTPDEHYQNMYAAHDPIAGKISQMFSRREINPQVLNEIIAMMIEYRDAWKKALKIRDKQKKRVNRPLNINQIEPPEEIDQSQLDIPEMAETDEEA